jgi:hypothetical protein
MIAHLAVFGFAEAVFVSMLVGFAVKHIADARGL